jgi:DNA (cytosine-5)-methyltransferase 1
MVTLFCGMGGWDVGAAMAGVRPVLAVDRDPYPLALYHENLPEVPLLVRDVRAVAGREVHALTGRVDLLHASPPCTPYSPAGHRRGSADPEDALPAVVRLAAEVRPRWLTLENVPSVANDPTFTELVAGLRAVGYALAWRVLVDAADYGVPQRRRRLFLAAGPPSAMARFQWPPATHRDPARRGDLPPWVSAWEAVGDLLAARLAEEGADLDAEALRREGRLMALRNLGRGRGSPLSLPAPTVTRRQPLAVVVGPLPLVPAGRVRLHDDPFPAVRRPVPVVPLHARARYARRLTARELARLQAIPDGFRLGRVSEHRAAMAVGDAVPPPFARALAAAIREADGGR